MTLSKTFLFALSAILLLSTAPIAHAADIEHCGEPVETTLPTDPAGFCDIYTRQLAYRLEANELRKRIYERQQNFQAPAVAAREQYEKEIAKLNEQRGNEENSNLNE